MPQHVHTYTARPFSCCPSLSFSVTHINSPPPQQISVSVAFTVSLTPNHWLPLIWNDSIVKQLKHWKYQIPHTIRGGGGGGGGGGWRLQKSYWQKAIGRQRDWLGERMAEPSVQSRRNKTFAMCPDCRLIAMRILYYTSQPLINKYAWCLTSTETTRLISQLRTGGRGYGTEVGEEPRIGEGDNIPIATLSPPEWFLH